MTEGKKTRHWHRREGEGVEGGCGKKEEKGEEKEPLVLRISVSFR